MKIATRAFVIALTATGLAAVSHVSVSAQQNRQTVVAAKVSAFPIPLCPWDDPNACGIAGPPQDVARR